MLWQGFKLEISSCMTFLLFFFWCSFTQEKISNEREWVLWQFWVRPAATSSPVTDACKPPRLLCCSWPTGGTLLHLLPRALSPCGLRSWLSCFFQLVTWHGDLSNHLWTAPHLLAFLTPLLCLLKLLYFSPRYPSLFAHLFIICLSH